MILTKQSIRLFMTTCLSLSIVSVINNPATAKGHGGGHHSSHHSAKHHEHKGGHKHKSEHKAEHKHHLKTTAKAGHNLHEKGVRERGHLKRGVVGGRYQNYPNGTVINDYPLRRRTGENTVINKQHTPAPPETIIVHPPAK